TRTLGIRKRPSACATASYFVPVSIWVAEIVTPGSTPPCWSATTPLNVPVVTGCAAAGRAASTTVRATPIAHTKRVFRHFIGRLLETRPQRGGSVRGSPLGKVQTKFYSEGTTAGLTKKAAE